MSSNSATDKVYQYALEFKMLSKAYKKTMGLGPGFSCGVKKAQNTVLLGGNGAGKTTLLSIITNTRFADDGAVLINGVCSRDPYSRSRLRYLPEDIVLPPKCNLLDIVREYRENKCSIDVSEVKILAKEFGCVERIKQKFGSMSKGQKRLLLLSLILSGKPEIVILDEPMEGLDPINIHKVRMRIKEMCSSGTTVFQSTHRIHEAEQHGGNYIIIDSGTFVIEGEMSVLREYCKISLEDSELAGILAKDVKFANEEFVIVSRNELQDICTESGSLPPSVGVTLEDVFLCSVHKIC